MTNEKKVVLETYKEVAKAKAEKLQTDHTGMTGSEINAQDDYIPDFRVAVKNANMNTRKAGQTDGFICRSSQGRVVRLIQRYDSTVYTDEPEELPAQWKFVWSQDPKKAHPFMSFATSPYAKGDCCTYEGHVWRSGQDTNTWAPGTVGVKWDDLGKIEDVMNG